MGEHDATISGGVGWRHAFGELAPSGDASRCSACRLPPIRQRLEAGLDLKLGTATSLGIAYAGQLAADASIHVLSARLDGQF